MKLCIVKPDGNVAEVLMSERQPFLEVVNNELLFFENFEYKLIIRDSEVIDNTELFVGDYQIPLHYDSVTDCLETETGLIFEGCFDLACISIYIEDGEGDERVFYTDFLRVATTKQTAKQVEQMLGEIEENLPNFLEACFSRNRKKSGMMNDDIRSIWNTLKIIDEIIKVYEENYGYFSNHKKASVEFNEAIVDVKSMRMVDQESLKWIVCNPDSLIKTDQDSGIVINGRNYIPTKIKTYVSQYSYEVYENKVVLGFLQNVIDYIDYQVVGFNKEIIELKNIPECILVQLPNTHELTGRCVYIYYKGVIRQFSDKKMLLQEIYYRYEKILECQAEVIHGIPKLTNTFKHVYYYRLCYECMIKWFDAGDYTFDHINYLFKLKTLSRIFEYFCLIKLQAALVQCGYTFQGADKITYSLHEDTECINNQYIFSGNGYELRLLYEPFIWVNKVNERVNLYSTGYNFLKSKWSNKWTPDFILKISGRYKEYYYILDAKYSNAYNVKKRSMPELVLKYGTQIASKDKFYSDVIGIGAIYPGDIDKIYYFKKNVVNSRKQSLPNYFSLTIVGGNAGNAMLTNRILELMKVVELIEQNKENEENLKEKKAAVNKKDIVNEEGTLEIVKQNFRENKPTLKEYTEQYFDDNKELSGEKISVTKVNGKKCFYYAKGRCMCQKSICSIVDESCAFYVSKNSKEYLKEESTCRNFEHYIRRGKREVKCLVSGHSGCVGIEDCKFYMKKNKSRK